MSDDDSLELNQEEQEALDAAETELEVQQEESVETDPSPADDGSPTLSQDAGEGGTESADASSGWQQALEQAGFQSFDDVDRAVSALVQSNRQRDEQIKQYADQVRFYQDQFKVRDVTSQQQQEPPKPEKEVDLLDQMISDWQDPNWANQYIEIDEEGNRVISDGVDAETREKILGIDRKLRQWQEVIQDPRQFAQAVDKRVERMIQERFESSYQQKQTQAQEQSAIDQFVNQNATWLYERDPATGQYLQDHVTGEFIYSEQGDQFVRHMDALAADGISSISKQIQYAQMAMGVNPATQSHSNQEPTVQETAQQQRKAMQGRTNAAKPKPKSFNGVAAESGGQVTGTQQMSFGEETLAALKAGVE